MQNYSDESEELHDDNISGVEKGYNYIVNNKEYFICLTSEYEYEVALMASHVIKEREFVYRTNSYGTHRDMLMAFYSEWWQRILAEDAKVAIWAHNAHVFDGSSGGSSLMGTFLSGSQGDNYRNVGFSFGKGSANAFLAKFDYSFSSGVRSQIISDVPCNTSNFIMNEVDGDQFYIIFDELDGPSKTYFNSSQPFLQFGGGFNPTFINNYIFDTNLVSGFDVMIHFDETQASVLK
jgi:erythromycin esterase-like protein